VARLVLCPPKLTDFVEGVAMIDTLSRLKSLPEPIKLAIIGTGSAGTGLGYQSGITPGIECVALCDIELERARQCADSIGRKCRVVERPEALRDAIREGVLAVCQDGELLARCESVDVLIEASNSIPRGGHHAVTALENATHVVMMNAEADLVFGPYLTALAREHHVVYTSCDGDQPGVIRRMVDDVRLWGFELVMAGNIKGFLDRYANPTTIAPEADKRYLDHKMCASYTDGSKLCVEMALVANALGLETDVPGMHGPKAQHVLDIPKLFDFDRMHQEGKAVVDYVIGPEPKGGVFAVGYSDSRYQQKMLGWFPAQLGDGPFYVFRRPYHLIHIEAMRCVAEAFLDGEALLQPTYGFRTNVFTYAKRALRAGDKLDGLGGYACYGLIENCGEALEQDGYPICLAEDVVVRRDIAEDERILMDDVDCDVRREDMALYVKAVEASRLGTSTTNSGGIKT
jgi:predicted homoserine dehydrogenase-like protein